MNFEAKSTLSMVRSMNSLFQTATGAWHLPSILMVLSWLLGSALTGAFIFANLKVNRDERIDAFDKDQQSIIKAQEAQSKIAELEGQLEPRTITEDQRLAFVEATSAGPFGPVVLATRTAIPNKEQEDYTMYLRQMLDEAGFGRDESDIVNGFGTSIDPGEYLLFVTRGETPPPYFSNLASALYEIGFVSLENPIAINNPSAEEGALYLFVPEK